MFPKIIFFCLLSFLPFSSLAQMDHEDVLSKTFKRIVRTDQSNFRKNDIRDSIILSNFELIHALLSDSINLNTEQPLKKRTHNRLHMGLALTFIHLMQIDPHILMNEETSDFLAKHIEANTINRRELSIALAAYQKDLDNDRAIKEYRPYYIERLKLIKQKWRIEK